jgi:hypothetical protein
MAPGASADLEEGGVGVAVAAAKVAAKVEVEGPENHLLGDSASAF